MTEQSAAQRRRRVIVSATLVGVLGVGLIATVASGAGARNPGRGGPHHPPPVDVSVTPQAGTIQATQCGAAMLTVTLTNDTDEAFYTDVYIEAEDPLRSSRSAISSYLPEGYSYDVPLEVTAPLGSEFGTYELTLDGHREPVTVPVTIEAPADHSNLARAADPSASSTHPSFSLCGPTDGNRSQSDWTSTGWNDGTRGEFPDWYQLTFAEPEQVSVVEVVTRDGPSTPASLRGMRDWDVQTRIDGQWVTVDEVRGNENRVVRSTFDPVVTDAVRLLIHASNDGRYSRILEMEVYANTGS